MPSISVIRRLNLVVVRDGNSASTGITTTATSNNDVYAHLPPHFEMWMPGRQKFYGGEEHTEQALIAMLEPFGIDRLVLHRPGKNSDVNTLSEFPRKWFTWQCRNCKPQVREQSLCGLKVRMLLVLPDGERPYLEVREFSLPATSRHLLVSKGAWETSGSKVVNNEDKLTPNMTKLLMNLGKSRTKTETANNVIADTFDGLRVGTNLLHRVMKKGRDEAWGASETESMMIFYATGLKHRDLDEKYGVEGKFYARTCSSTGKLICWYEQLPLEVLNARAYGQDAAWTDTTHNATMLDLKTGPPSTCDWGGLTAPVGLFQVPEEEIEVTKDMMKGLELDAPDATSCTDGGSAWPAIAEDFDQNQVEDTHHNSRNADKKVHSSKLSKEKKQQFIEMKNKVLYHVFVPASGLDEHFNDMRNVAEGEPELLRWIDRMDSGKVIRTATYTTKLCIMSAKGCTSRCEVMMAILKGGGTLKAEMRHWTLPELQHRHRNMYDNYIEDASTEIRTAIKEKRTFSHYVLDLEKEETKHVHNLTVSNVTPSVPNPFHGKLQSSKKTVAIRIRRPSNAISFGLSLTPKVVGNVCTLEVAAIHPGSVFEGSKLQVGMLIHTVSGQTFNNSEEGIDLLKSAEGAFNILADTLPSMGTVYTIHRKNVFGKGGKMERQVFIPDRNNNGHTLHCQSNHHIHTAFWIRCCYIQRALMEHPTRSKGDETTMHSRWRISQIVHCIQ